MCLATQSYSTLCYPMDCSPPGSSVHGISQARILEWVVISSSKNRRNRQRSKWGIQVSEQDFPGGPVVKNPAANAEDVGSLSELGRSPRGGHGNPLQYSSLENSIDREAWQAVVHWAAKSQTRLKRLSTAQHVSGVLSQCTL